MNKPPLISVGVPAYNSAATLGSTIEGLLAQSFGDFELIVSDNASTDGTRDVVEEYKLRDSRIRYERHPVNIGANANYSHVVRCARGQFFKWSSSSDWCAPTFLARCLDELLLHGDAVLAAPRTRLFQGNPSRSEDYPFDIEILDDTPHARLERLYRTLRLNNAMNGLIRMSALQRTRLVDPYLSADVVLMIHLALLGKFRLLSERLFYRRMEAAFATALQDPEAVLKHHYPQPSARTLLQGSKQHMGRVRAALSTPMPIDEKLRSLVYVAKTCFWERKAVLDDIQGVWRYLARRTRIE